jgi:hypothetical protein
MAPGAQRFCTKLLPTFTYVATAPSDRVLHILSQIADNFGGPRALVFQRVETWSRPLAGQNLEGL